MAGSGGSSGNWGGSSGAGSGISGSSSGGGGGTGPDCPLSFKTALIGPAGACAVGDLLEVIFHSTPPPGRIVCVHVGTGATVGSIGGIPGLSKLIECLKAGVQYEAHVNNIAGGRVDVTVNLV